MVKHFYIGIMMTKLIPFPGTANGNSKYTVKKINPIIKPLSDKMVIGTIDFTCVQCRTTSKFNTENMIFKHLEFFCGCCGSHYKITNPAFGKSEK